MREAQAAHARSEKSEKSKHIYCSFISIHQKLNPPRETDAKPQFA